jgi:hypothetical protein
VLANLDEWSGDPVARSFPVTPQDGYIRALTGIMPQETAPMNPDLLHGQKAGNRSPVIALHCSDAGESQWYPLDEALGTPFKLYTSEHFGRDSRGIWRGDHAFALAGEALKAIGHSLGCARDTEEICC